MFYSSSHVKNVNSRNTVPLNPPTIKDNLIKEWIKLTKSNEQEVAGAPPSWLVTSSPYRVAVQKRPPTFQSSSAMTDHLKGECEAGRREEKPRNPAT